MTVIITNKETKCNYIIKVSRESLKLYPYLSLKCSYTSASIDYVGGKFKRNRISYQLSTIYFQSRDADAKDCAALPTYKK